ncbi:MAG: winged helix-turn-helix domain-containing protein [Caulobacteraceae bacterium]|nr:winged helix-turn-helix domain-containing protein [Caulobacteraceae bacterium]
MSADDSPRVIDLARQERFQLGAIEVRPSTRELLVGDRRDVLEPRVMQVLVALARRRGEVVSRHDLIDECWGGRAVSEDAVHRCISMVRRLATAYGGFSVMTVARVGYRLSADEPTSQGGAEPDSPTATSSPQDGAPLLAVLAFDNLSGDADTAYFSDGVAEEILHAVARAPNLRVIARSSSFQFRGADKAVRRVVEDLKATHLLDGSVRRAGSQVRISAQLVDCASQTMLWSERFDRDLADVLAVQDEIATAVAAALKVALAPATPAGSMNAAAYDLFLKMQAELTTATAEEAIRRLEPFTTLAPDFAPAWARLALARSYQLRWGERKTPYAEAREAVVQAAETALRLDPKSGVAWMALSALQPLARYAERERLLRAAVSASPNEVRCDVGLGEFLDQVGRTREAMVTLRGAFELDPLFPATVYRLGDCLFRVGAYEAGQSFHAECRRRWPNAFDFGTQAAGWAAFSGDWKRFDEIMEATRAAGRETPAWKQLMTAVDAIRGRNPYYAGWLLQSLKARVAAGRSPNLSGIQVLFKLGLREETFALLEEASFASMFAEEGRNPAGASTPALIFDRVLWGEEMRDPRFVRLCAKMGLADYWMATGHWPDCADDVPYDFRAEARRLTGAPTH